MNLTQDKSRNIITLTWLIFFSINIITLLYLRLDNWIEKEDLIEGLKTISTAYGGYLSAIIAFYLSKRDSDENTAVFKPSSFYIGFFCSIIWNLMITLFLLPLAFGSGYFENTLETLSNVTSIFSWLVGAAMGFFFAKNN